GRGEGRPRPDRGIRLERGGGGGFAGDKLAAHRGGRIADRRRVARGARPLPCGRNQGTKGAFMSDPATIDHDPGTAARKKRRRFAVITWLAFSLMLVLALVATSPYWAEHLASILPWGPDGGSGGA